MTSPSPAPAGYRLLERPGDDPRPESWIAARHRDGGRCVLLCSDVCCRDAQARDALLERLRAWMGRAGAARSKLRLPVHVAPHGERGVVVELESPRLELGQRDAYWAATTLGINLQRAPQEAARLALALTRALALIVDTPDGGHFQSDRVLLSADGRLRFDPVTLAPFQANRAGSLAVTFSDHPPESVEGAVLSEASYVFFVGLMLYRFGAGCPARRAHDSPTATLTDVATNTLHPDTKRLARAAPGLARVAARATHRDIARRHATLRDLELDLFAWAADVEDTFPHPNTPTPDTPARLLEVLRESFSAGHLSAALAHLDRAPPPVYDHPTVRDYVQHHVRRAQLARAFAALYTSSDASDAPLDWAAFHLAAQHPRLREHARAGLAPHRTPPRGCSRERFDHLNCWVTSAFSERATDDAPPHTPGPS